MTNISYTAQNMYIECGVKYKLHYIDKLRSQTVNSALVFGKAFDRAIEVLLIYKDVAKAKIVFDDEFASVVGPLGNTIDTRTSSMIVYGNNDIDWDLIDSNSDNAPWESMSKKGHILIDSFNTSIVPKIKKVIAFQPLIELENSSGDKVVGKADFVVEWFNGEIHIVDLKTSGMLYSSDSVEKSVQLAIYDAALKVKYNADKCAYWVALKNINKNKKKVCSKCGMDGTGTSFRTCNRGTGKARCKSEWLTSIDPKAYIQVIIGNVDPVFQSRIIENLNEVNSGIKQKVFFRNMNSCIHPVYKSKCTYYNLCHSNDSEGLVKKP